MKYHFLFLTLFCLHFFSVHSETLREKKGFELIGNYHWTRFSTSPGGDVNGDGYPDIVLLENAINYKENFVYVVFGGPTESLSTFELANMTTKQGFRVKTSNANMTFESVTAVDLNKDGYADLVVIVNVKDEPGATVTLRRVSRLYVIFGGPSLSEVDINTMNNTEGFRIHGTDGNYGHDGITTSLAGDVNGDGYQDLMIKTHTDVYVIYGRSSLSAFDVVNMTSEQGFKINFCKDNSSFEMSFQTSSADDINNDGYADLLIPVLSYRERSNNYIFVVYGGKSLKSFDLRNMTSSQGFNISMGMDRIQMTPEVNPAGDFNKDGYVDIIIGNPEDNKTGAAFIVYGGRNLTSFDIRNMTESQGIKITGHVDAERELYYPGFGRSVNTAGDFNKDGYADVIVGAPSKNMVDKFGPPSGAVYVIYGGKSLSNFNVANITSQQGITVTNPSKGGKYFGSQVNNLGDINKDGYDDMIITVFAEKPDRNKAYVLFGAPNA